MVQRFPTLLLLGFTMFAADAADPAWTKHTVMELGHCNTAVALPAGGKAPLDVIASFDGKVSLFVAPDWHEVVLHRFPSGGGCIHSTTLDADGDGDLDWVGTLANRHPFWLENPGPQAAAQGAWAARPIDPEITGIHCIRRADVDRDGRDDLIINNFEPEKGLGDSIAWFRAPANARKAVRWPRFVFAQGDARGGSHYMGAGDVDGDGYPEIAVGAKGKPFADGNWFAFWKHPGKGHSGTRWQKVMLAKNQTGATNVLPADVNGDGKCDWVASRGHGEGVLWFRNPDWALITIDAKLKYPHSLTVADHDGDGDPDIASCGYGSEKLMWYENDGQGNFRAHTLDAAQQSYHLSTVDMDGDGDLDLLNAGRGTKNVAWYENPTK